MNVLIVARTKVRSRVCLGGLELSESRSLRLVDQGGYFFSPEGPFAVGLVWDLEWVPASGIVPPHVEDVVLRSSRFVRAERSVRDLLLATVSPWTGPLAGTFDGRLACTPGLPYSLYACRGHGIPARSAWYWVVDRELVLENGRYVLRKDGLTVLRVAYVGAEAAPRVLSAGTLVYLSLARWWRPDDVPDAEERCYLQISGCYS